MPTDYSEVKLAAFADELQKISAKSTAYLFKDPLSYTERAKVRQAIRGGTEAKLKRTQAGKGVGAGGGALLGGLGGALAGYYGGHQRALPAVLGGLAGAAGGGVGGYFGGREIGRYLGGRKMKEFGIHPVSVEKSPELQQKLRPALQSRGLDVHMQDRPAYSKEDIAKMRQNMLARVGSPDPAVLRRLGLPTLR